MEKLSFLVSLITKDNDYQREQASSAQAAALKLGASVQIVYANNSAVEQTQQILSFVQEPAKRPTAILVEPVGTAMERVARAAVAAGIGWGLINTEADYVTSLRQHALVPVFSFLSDHEEIGRIQGRQIAAILGDEGCILHVEGPAVRNVANLRTKGMMSTRPERVTVKSLRGDWTHQSGYRVVKSWLSLSTSRELHIGMVVCQNDDMAMGARQAFEEVTVMQERDQWLRLPLTGCDGIPTAGQSWVRQGWLTATVFSPPLVGEAMLLAANAINAGAQPPQRTLVAPSSFPALAELKRAHSPD